MKWKDWKNWILNVLFGICLTAVCWIVSQTFFLTSFRVPSDSMVPTLLPGDVILVEKLSYGARVFDWREALQGREVEIDRLPGLETVDRGDVVVFHNPCPKEWMRLEMDMMKYYVKRCVALPGDTFCIEQGVYKVEGYDGALGDADIQRAFALQIAEEQYDANHPLMRVYPDSRVTGWRPDNFGPLYIPKAGDCMPMDERSVLFYRNLIEWETKDTLYVEGDEVCLGDSVITEYRFCHNYYFMTGDKVADSRDSRYWGLVPEDFIVGRVCRILRSEDKYTGETRWERFLKKVE